MLAIPLRLPGFAITHVGDRIGTMSASLAASADPGLSKAKFEYDDVTPVLDLAILGRAAQAVNLDPSLSTPRGSFRGESMLRAHLHFIPPRWYIKALKVFRQD